MITKVEKKDQVEISIGEDFSTSGKLVYKDPLSGVSVTYSRGNQASCPNYGSHAISARYSLFCWRVKICDKDVVARIESEIDRNKWADLIFNEVITILASTNQMAGVFQHSVNMVYNKGVEDGGTQKVLEFQKLLRI